MSVALRMLWVIFSLAILLFALLFLKQSAFFGYPFGEMKNDTDSIGNIGEIIAAFVALYAVMGGSQWLGKFYIANKQAQDFQKNRAYADLDDFYIKILNLAIERPYLRMNSSVSADFRSLNADYKPFSERPGLTTATLGLPENSADWTSADVEKYYLFERAMTDYREKEYDAYAFMVWNFLETIHDRCEEHADLLNTWAPIVAAENDFHRGWFLQQMRDQACRIESAESKSETHIRSDKFCYDFQVFIYECNFRPNPDYKPGQPPQTKYPNWNYVKHKDKLGNDIKRKFTTPPIAQIKGKPVKIWDA